MSDIMGASDGAGSPRMRIAYLTNRYPAVSHSFIRREIEALETLGFDILRHSIRAPQGELPDPQDQAERERTFYVLGRGAAALLLDYAIVKLTRPLRFLRALGLAWRMAEPSPQSLFRHAAYLAEACLLARRLERLGIAHIHVHFGTNPTAVARLVHSLTGISYSFTVHGPDEFDAPAALDLRGKIADAALAFGVSSFGRSQLMRWSDPGDWHKLHVIRCSVGADYVSEAALPGPPSGRTLCCVARLSPQKGLPLLIEAAALLHRRGTDFRLRLVGDGELRGSIEAAIARHGLGDKVEITGWRGGAAVRAYLAESRALVLASFAEGLPVVIMEAMALGRPVVATAIAGIPELVDANCGWVVKAGSAEALAEAMQQALDADEERLQEMGRIARARVLDLHAPLGNAEQLRDLLMRLPALNRQAPSALSR